jgi:hypothetical protein
MEDKTCQRNKSCGLGDTHFGACSEIDVAWHNVYVHHDHRMWRLASDHSRELLCLWSALPFTQVLENFRKASNELLVEVIFSHATRTLLQRYHGNLDWFPGVGDVVEKLFRQDVEAAVPEPSSEQKETPPLACSFCEYPAVASNSILSTCLQHGAALSLHAGRMEIGLPDCPETRAETLRFVVRDQARQALELAQSSGFRTKVDRVRQSTRSSIAESKASPEEIPLVGTTPHYEWP